MADKHISLRSDASNHMLENLKIFDESYEIVIVVSDMIALFAKFLQDLTSESKTKTKGKRENVH